MRLKIITETKEMKFLLIILKTLKHKTEDFKVKTENFKAKTDEFKDKTTLKTTYETDDN